LLLLQNKKILGFYKALS